MKPIVGRTDDGKRFFVLDSGFSATRVDGVWSRGAPTADELMEDYRLVKGEMEIQLLIEEAKHSISPMCVCKHSLKAHDFPDTSCFWAYNCDCTAFKEKH